MKPIRLLLMILCLSPLAAYAQTAEVGGAVQDPSGAVIPKASVELRNQDTGVRRQTITNNSGQYRIAGIDPGKYDATVQAKGFKSLTREDIVFQVGDKAQIDFKMQVGQSSESVTVDGSGLQLNTSDASVSTVVDRKFVETMPLNGRSFQSLILLAPGVVTTSPQDGTIRGATGEFSVNGQRADANSYMIDGISANSGGYAGAASTAASAGSLGTSSVLGTTQALISVDALQEFRISTSSYTAEYGRQPGAQISFQTRSGTNDWHGTIFDYFRNGALDANNWFNDYTRPVIRKPAERQNDFGGVLGGPLGIPRLYSGRDRLFFFFSYEGLRLEQPQAPIIVYVPSNGTYNTGVYPNPQSMNLRANSPAALQPVLNAFVAPNCTIQQNPQCIDYHDGLSPAIITASLPSKLNAISGRIDYQLSNNNHLFYRYSDTTSAAVTSETYAHSSTNGRARASVLGLDSTISHTLSNQFRLGYSPTFASTNNSGLSSGGATPTNLFALQGIPASGQTTVFMFFPSGDTAELTQSLTGGPQHQWNINDAVGWTLGKHQLRVGFDYRRTTSYIDTPGYAQYPLTEYLYYSPANVLSNTTAEAYIQTGVEQDPAFTNISSFLQDEWHVSSRVSLSLGLRWDVNPPPAVVGGPQQPVVNGDFSNPSSLTLAPAGTPLYKTTYGNFAPRLGVATTLHTTPGKETILRAGGGVYFDTGQAFEQLYGIDDGPGQGASQLLFGSAFPLSPSQLMLSSFAAPYGLFATVAPDLQLPYSLQWNVSLEQAIDKSDSLTIGYVGSNGRRLLESKEIRISGNPEFTQILRYENGYSSSYNSLQLQYKRTLGHGLQAVASYTWSHALDFASQDTFVLLYQRGNADFDVRNSLSAAVSYEFPKDFKKAWERSAIGGWGFDTRLTSRSAFPVEVDGSIATDPSGHYYYGLLNYNGGNPYIRQAGIPGGRKYNPSVFSVPTAGQTGNAPRNFMRGFGETELNVALRRDFPIYEKVHLQFRAEAFNLLNHPNFGAVSTTCGTSVAGQACSNPLLGEATGTLASALGGGLTPLYQQGGARSLQLALKMIF